MKRILKITMLLLLAVKLQAQYEPQYSMYVFNKLAYNPAYAGSKECLSVTALYRNQWSGIQGAPSTIVASAHMPFAGNRNGIGLTLTNDRLGLLNNLYGQLAYAYRIPIRDGVLSAGLQGEVEYAQIDWKKANPLDPNDPDIPVLNENRTRFNFGAGLYYYNPKFFVGLSAPRFFKTSYYKNTDVNGGNGQKDKRTYYGMGGLIIPLGKNVKFRPTALISYNPSAPFEWEANASFLFSNTLWLGLSYRSADSFDAFVQYELLKGLRAGIGYDFTTSELRRATSGSWEIMVEYLFDCCSKANMDHIRFF